MKSRPYSPKQDLHQGLETDLDFQSKEITGVLTTVTYEVLGSLNRNRRHL